MQLRSHLVEEHRGEMTSNDLDEGQGHSRGHFSPDRDLTDVIFYGVESNHLVDTEKIIRYAALKPNGFSLRKTRFELCFPL